MVLSISCDNDNCDLNHYPSAPYGTADDTIYGDNYVRYLYVCYTSSYNKVVTYEIVGDCWEMYVDDNYNICLLYTSPSPRDGLLSRMPSSA